MLKSKILIVEDEPVIGKNIYKILRHKGYDTVGPAKNSEDAVRMALHEKPHVVIMDIEITGDSDGIETAKRINETADIPVLYLTAHSDDETIQRARETDPYGYIIKPINSRELIAAIELAVYKHRIETELKRSEEKFYDLYNNAPDMYISINAESGEILECNDTVLKTTGYDKDELIGRTVFEIYHPDSRERAAAVYKKFQETGEVKGEDLMILKKDGSTGYVNLSASAVRSETGKIIKSRSIWRDITDKKILERQLVENEERFRLLFENSPLPYQSLDIDGKVVEVNNSWLKVLGYKKEEVLGKSIRDFLDQDSLGTLKENFSRFRESGEVRGVEFFMRKKNNEKILVSVNGKLSYRRDGSSKQTHCIFRDITEQREAERKLEASLNEKDILLKEVHHRVKNNMQVIISLINLQAGYVEDPVILEFFKDTMYRIRSMALVHEKLYQSESISAINFGDYIRALTSDISQQYVSGGLRGEVKVDVEDITMGIDRAIPCGIIINELVSNSFKHGFQEIAHGVININFYKTGNSDVVLQVSDNGKGLTESFDIRNIKSLGMQLVDSLVLQINGTLDIKKQGGASFTITFPIKD
jgi:PAS domain S-box-containing protein